MARGQQPGQYITNNNNIIRIIMNQEGNSEGGGKEDYPRQHLCGGFSDRESREKLRSMYRMGRDRSSPQALGRSPLCSLSDQVPVEVIRNLLTGTRRGHRGPRNHVVCWAIVCC